MEMKGGWKRRFKQKQYRLGLPEEVKKVLKSMHRRPPTQQYLKSKRKKAKREPSGQAHTRIVRVTQMLISNSRYKLHCFFLEQTKPRSDSGSVHLNTTSAQKEEDERNENTMKTNLFSPFTFGGAVKASCNTHIFTVLNKQSTRRSRARTLKTTTTKLSSLAPAHCVCVCECGCAVGTSIQTSHHSRL